MKDFVRHIRYLLRKNDSIIIPGLGALIAVDLPALINEKGECVIEPSREVYFDNSITTDEKNLLNYSLQKILNISKEECESKIGNLVSGLRQNLKNHGLFILGRIGQFYLKNGQIDFTFNRQYNPVNPYAIFGNYGGRLKKGINNILSFTEYKRQAMA